MRRRLSLLTVLLVATTVALASGQIRPQVFGIGPLPNADGLFDDPVLHEVRLFINSADWQTLKDHYLENTYYPCDLHWRDQIVRNIGIRQRGTGSRSPIKPGLGVDFARYVSGQKFLGLKAVVLRNNTQDPSNVNERLSMLLFRRLGLPAPREVHTTLYVNNEYVGLYTVVESIDENYLTRNYGESDGYLYSYDYPTTAQPYYFEYRGSDPGLYVPLPFKPETHSSDAKPEVIEQLVWTINETSDATFRTAISQYIDLTQFVRFVAVETFLTDNDGFLGDWGMNNYYMYRSASSTQFMLNPWDKSEAFKGAPTANVFHNINDVSPAQQNRLMMRVLSYPDLRGLYLDTLLEAVRSAEQSDTAGGPGWLEREILREYGQIRDAALADPVKPFTNTQFQAAIDGLGVFARHRGESVVQQVNRARTAALRRR
jgi:spore coat protein CotH